MLIADLFIMVPKWKQAKCPLKGEWVKSWVFNVKLGLGLELGLGLGFGLGLGQSLGLVLVFALV